MRLQEREVNSRESCSYGRKSGQEIICRKDEKAVFIEGRVDRGLQEKGESSSNRKKSGQEIIRKRRKQSLKKEKWTGYCTLTVQCIT